MLQECLNEFQASFRRRESIKYRNGQRRGSQTPQDVEKDLKHKMVLEDQVQNYFFLILILILSTNIISLLMLKYFFFSNVRNIICVAGVSGGCSDDRSLQD